MWTYKWSYLFPEHGEGEILVGPSEVTFGVHGQTVWVDYFETPNVRFMFTQHVVNNSWLKVRMYQKSPLFRIKKVTFIPFVTFRQILLTTCWRGQHKFGIRGFEVVIWGLHISKGLAMDLQVTSEYLPSMTSKSDRVAYEMVDGCAGNTKSVNTC